MKNNINRTIMQYFEWYLPSDASLWNKLSNESKNLFKSGVTDVWLPPAYKGSQGITDVGYAVYDLFDLGEFNQKGTIPTKYGTKEEYINCIESLHNEKIKVIADIVLNHKMGADSTEKVLATKTLSTDRTISESSEPEYIEAWTSYTFPGRNDKYSSFKWNWTHFDGIDWDEAKDSNAIYKFYGKNWAKEVDHENGNYDYLMGADLDLNNLEVVNELISWGQWYLKECDLDGFRIDAVKHISAPFFKEWLHKVEPLTDKNLIVFGEYWSRDLTSLKEYLAKTENLMGLFDVPLHYNFKEASTQGNSYDLRNILNNSLLSCCPDKAVTFVDNHDTEPGQSLESFIDDWFKPLAYALILLREQGTPCVFYGDYYGIPAKDVSAKKDYLDTFMKVRKYLVYGVQTDYFDDPNIIGWTIKGSVKENNSCVAVVMSNNYEVEGSKTMHIDSKLAGHKLYDVTKQFSTPVILDKNGDGVFPVKAGNVSVWIRNDVRFFGTEKKSEEKAPDFEIENDDDTNDITETGDNTTAENNYENQ